MRLARTLIGMVHLLPLPGSPRWAGSMQQVLDAALADATALLEGGMDALLVENHGDVPFTRDRVEAATVAAMGIVAHEIRRAIGDVPLGVNVLKNDARSAVAIACAARASFIRTNVHAGAVVADQGIVQSDAYWTLRDRRLLAAEHVQLLADVPGKHAMPLAPVPIEQEARDLVHRSLADALVVTGAATGEPTADTDIERVRRAVPDVPVLVGSGATPETIGRLLTLAHGAIVGTALKEDGDVRRPVDPGRVKRLVAAARGA
jgi:membrane complex biogenesis BtpA family protein